MKKLICVIAVLCLCQTFNLAHAQRYLPGQKGIQLTGGMADGFKKPGKPESAYYFGAALATYTKNGNRWVVGAEYFNKEYEYKNVTVPVSQFTGEGGIISKSFLTAGKHSFCPSACRLLPDTKQATGEIRNYTMALHLQIKMPLFMVVLLRWNWKLT